MNSLHDGPGVKTTRLAIIAVALAVFAPLWVSQVSGARIESDAKAYVQMSANLVRHGVISLRAEPPLRPSMYREPVPVLTTALAMSVSDALHGPADLAAYYEGERARHLKMQNVFWILMLCGASAWAIYLLTRSFAAAMVGAIAAHAPFYGDWVGGTLDSLYTEQAAAAALIAGSACLVAAVTRSRQLLSMALGGVAFGVLALIKAAFLYVFLGLIGLLLVAQLSRRLRHQLRLRFAALATLVMCFTAVLSPWLYRNWQHFGSVQIVERAGAILTLRAAKNEMTRVEYVGSFYFWAPRPVRPLVGSLLGFEPQDLMRGGRLQRLNRYASDFHADDIAAMRRGRADEAISFYYQQRAERNRLRRQFRAAGHPHPEVAADDALMNWAVDRLRSRPWRHAAMTGPFLWRGAFLPFPLLLCAVVYGLRRRRYDILLFALPAFGAVMFYGLFTHFILRYGVPAWPVALAVAVVLGALALQQVRERASRRFVPEELAGAARS